MTEQKNVMQINVPYLVTKAGNTGDITVGMHLMFNTPELLVCMETQGYVNDRAVINEILEGAEVTVDLVGVKRMKEVYLEAIKNLSGFPEPSEEEWEAFKNGFASGEAEAIVEAKDATIN